MAAKIYYQEDCNLSLLDGKTIAIIGYGSQGHAHALNLKESGCNVIIGLYEGSKSWAKAEQQGFEVFTAAEAAKKADIIMILINDEKQAALYKESIEPNLTEEDGVVLVARQLDLMPDVIKGIAFGLKPKFPNLVFVTGSAFGDKVTLTIMLGDEIVARGVNASKVIREAAKEIGGGGGGQSRGILPSGATGVGAPLWMIGRGGGGGGVGCAIALPIFRAVELIKGELK